MYGNLIGIAAAAFLCHCPSDPIPSPAAWQVPHKGAVIVATKKLAGGNDSGLYSLDCTLLFSLVLLTRPPPSWAKK